MATAVIQQSALESSQCDVGLIFPGTNTSHLALVYQYSICRWHSRRHLHRCIFAVADIFLNIDINLDGFFFARHGPDNMLRMQRASLRQA